MALFWICVVALVGRFGWEQTALTKHRVYQIHPSWPFSTEGCPYHPLYCSNLPCLVRGSQRDRCIWETPNDGSLKFSSILIVDKVAVSDVEDTSLVWHTHNCVLIKAFPLSQLLRHFSLAGVEKQISHLPTQHRVEKCEHRLWSLFGGQKLASAAC